MGTRALIWLAWRRLRRDGALSAALIAAALVAGAALAAVPEYASVGRELALRQALTGRPATVPDVHIALPGLPLDRQAYQAAAARMDVAAADALGTAPHVALRTLSTDPLTVIGPGGTRPGSSEPQRVVVRFRSGVEERVRITAGQAATPAAGPADGPIPVVMEAGAARRANLGPGARLRVRAAAAPEAAPATLVVSGLFEATDASDAYWRLRPELLEAAAGTTLLFVPETTLLGALVAALPKATFETSSDYTVTASDLRARDAATAERGLRALVAELAVDGTRARVEAPLLPVLAAFDRDAFVTRATLLPFGALAAVIAAGGVYALALIRERVRAGEAELLRTRGASDAQLRALAAIEATFGAVVAAALGPLLAAVAIVLVGRHEALRAFTHDALLDATPSRAAYAFGAAGAALAWVAAVQPAWRVAALADSERAPRRHVAALTLVVLVAAGAWLLVRDEPLIVASGIEGARVVRRGLLLAPWLLLTGVCAVLTLTWSLLTRLPARTPALLRRVVRAAEDDAARVALALVACAGALGVLAGASTPTLTRSAAARVAYAAGADARVVAATGAAVTAFPAAGDASTRVARAQARLASADGEAMVTVLGIESSTFGALPAARGSAPLRAMLEALATNVSAAAEPRLPADARQAGLWAQVPALAGAVEVSLLLRDGDGTVREVLLTREEPGAGAARGWRFVWAVLPAQAPAGAPATGWALGGVLLRVEGSAEGRAAFGPLLTVTTAPEETERGPTGQFAQGRVVFDFASPDAWEAVQGARAELTADTLSVQRQDPAPRTQSATLLQWAASTATAGPQEHGLRPGDGAPLLVYASRAAALATRLRGGDGAWLHAGGRAVRVEVAGVVDGFPTLDAGSAFLVGDLSRVLANANAAPAPTTVRVNEAWYAAADAAALRAALARALPAGATLVDGAAARRALDGDALQRALWSGALVLLSRGTLAVVVIGLLVVAARARGTSAALLVMTGVAGAAGVLAGDALAQWVVALLAHDAHGAPLAPALALRADWRPVAVAYAGLAAAVIVWPASRMLRYTRPRRAPADTD